MPAPKSVTIPMSMHIGTPARPIVKVGDLVKVGTKIAEADGVRSVPMHATVSGKVSKIGELLLADGTTVPTVVIESDGEMTAETLTPPTVDSRESLIEAVRESGVVGLGGAGFPTHVKLNVDPERIDYLIVNGAECEPYITSDTITMLDHHEDIELALQALKKYFGIKNIILGVESNNRAGAVAMRRVMSAVKENCYVQVRVLPTVYPQGGENVLIYHTTERIVPLGKLPIDVGCLVLNCTTLAAIGAYLRTGMPLVEKCVTVDGHAVHKRQNVVVPIGTALSDVFEFCGGLDVEPVKVIYGGPMMGVTVPDVSAPVMKNTNAVLALTEKEARLPRTTACIRCGACANVCPFGLAPVAISKAFENKDIDMLQSLMVGRCMECGCCSYVCPANRPLVQTNKLSKALIKEAAKGGA